MHLLIATLQCLHFFWDGNGISVMSVIDLNTSILLEVGELY